MTSEDKDRKKPKGPEDLKEEIQRLFKEKFGAEVFTIPLGLGMPGEAESPKEAPPAEDAEEEPLPDEILRFHMTPLEVKAYLDRFVVGQEEAKKTLAVAVCDHYHHVKRSLSRASKAPEPHDPSRDYVKQNVILLGPTGVGKTYLIRILAQLIGVPFVKADITKFSETGYVGGDVEDLVRELVRIADGNTRLAAHGIIFLDEIDKIASAPNPTGRDPSGRGVQIGLLKLMEDTDVPLRSPLDIGAQFQELLAMRRGAKAKRTINTRHILFVVSGAFSGLEEIIERRLSERNIGFAAAREAGDHRARNILSLATTRDFVEFGFEPEFIGRLPIRVALDDLTAEDLFEILRSSEGSILNQYRDSFHAYDIEVAFREDALRAIAERAYEERTGARGLMTVLETRLRDFKFRLPGSAVKAFAVTPRLVEDPAGELERILTNPEAAYKEYAEAAVDEFRFEFAKRHAVRLDLTPEAVEMARNVARELGRPVKDYLGGVFEPHAEFLKKIAEKSRLEALPVTPQVLSRPVEGLDLWLGGGKASQA